MCLRSRLTASIAFGRRRISPDFASMTSQNWSITKLKRFNNRSRFGTNRRQCRRKKVQFFSRYVATSSGFIPDASRALSICHGKSGDAGGSEIGMSELVLIHKPVRKHSYLHKKMEISPCHVSSSGRKVIITRLCDVVLINNKTSVTQSSHKGPEGSVTLLSQA